MTDSIPGVCVWLTGRSGAGKTTVTNALLPMLDDAGRTVTVLDTVPLLAKIRGERTSEGKLLRKAFVASEIVRHGGVVICVTVSARRSIREKAREVVGPEHFVEVHFDASAEVARSRRAHRGSRRSIKTRAKHALRPLARVTSARSRGSYEPPTAPAVTIDPVELSPEQGATLIFDTLVSRAFIAPRPASGERA